jgi:hypothetical protein
MLRVFLEIRFGLIAFRKTFMPRILAGQDIFPFRSGPQYRQGRSDPPEKGTPAALPSPSFSSPEGFRTDTPCFFSTPVSPSRPTINYSEVNVSLIAPRKGTGCRFGYQPGTVRDVRMPHALLPRALAFLPLPPLFCSLLCPTPLLSYPLHPEPYTLSAAYPMFSPTPHPFPVHHRPIRLPRGAGRRIGVCRATIID